MNATNAMAMILLGMGILSEWYRKSPREGQSPFCSEDCAKWGQTPAVLKNRADYSSHEPGGHVFGLYEKPLPK